MKSVAVAPRPGPQPHLAHTRPLPSGCGAAALTRAGSGRLASQAPTVSPAVQVAPVSPPQLPDAPKSFSLRTAAATGLERESPRCRSQRSLLLGSLVSQMPGNVRSLQS